jgi:hypothetical protein
MNIQQRAERYLKRGFQQSEADIVVLLEECAAGLQRPPPRFHPDAGIRFRLDTRSDQSGQHKAVHGRTSARAAGRTIHNVGSTRIRTIAISTRKKVFSDWL